MLINSQTSGMAFDMLEASPRPVCISVLSIALGQGMDEYDRCAPYTRGVHTYTHTVYCVITV
jgi:hypothetical protein